MRLGITEAVLAQLLDHQPGGLTSRATVEFIRTRQPHHAVRRGSVTAVRRHEPRDAHEPRGRLGEIMPPLELELREG